MEFTRTLQLKSDLLPSGLSSRFHKPKHFSKSLYNLVLWYGQDRTPGQGSGRKPRPGARAQAAAPGSAAASSRPGGGGSAAARQQARVRVSPMFPPGSDTYAMAQLSPDARMQRRPKTRLPGIWGLDRFRGTRERKTPAGAGVGDKRSGYKHGFLVTHPEGLLLCHLPERSFLYAGASPTKHRPFEIWLAVLKLLRADSMSAMAKYTVPSKK